MTYHWSRCPGDFVNVKTGEKQQNPTYMGNVFEWYHTLPLVIMDADEDALNGNGYTIICSWDVATILEHLVHFKPVSEATTFDRFSQKLTGTLSNKYAVYINLLIPNNEMFVLTSPVEGQNSEKVKVKILGMGLLDD